MNSISIRKLKKEDLELVLQWRNEPSVRNNMYTNHIISVEEHSAWFEKCQSDKSIITLIFERNMIPAGMISFSKINDVQGTAEWAFYSGNTTIRGVGTLMELCALRYAFNKLSLRKLCCEVLSFNESVIKFHKKFGFQVEGIKKRHYLRGKEVFDIYQLAIFKDEWESQVSALEEKYLSKFKVKI